MSHYKLPHYIFVVYPLCAVMTAGFICREDSRYQHLFKWLRTIQLIISVIVVSGAVFLSSYIFPAQNFVLWTIVFLFLATVIYFFLRPKSLLEQLIAPSAIAIIAVNFLFSVQVYPSLLKYQFGSEMATIVKQENIQADQLYFYKCYSHSFEFYAQTIVPPIHGNEMKRMKESGKNLWVIGGEDLLTELKREHLQPQQQFTVNDHAVSLLTVTFLNPETRLQVVRKMYLCKL